MRYAWEYWDNMSNKPTDLERTSLEAHVDLCAMRYSALDERLTNIELKVDKIAQIIDDFKAEIVKLAFKGAIFFILAIGATVGVIKL
jgi:hypothetical protein